MKEGSLMRVLFCKFQCPFICFCKPSAAHIYTSGPLKLENTPQLHVVPSTDFPAVSNDKSSYGVKEGGVNGNQQLKSCIRKHPNVPDATKEIGKKRVQWMDNLGKELAEIKEFESRASCSDGEPESCSVIYVRCPHGIGCPHLKGFEHQAVFHLLKDQKENLLVPNVNSGHSETGDTDNEEESSRCLCVIL